MLTMSTVIDYISSVAVPPPTISRKRGKGKGEKELDASSQRSVATIALGKGKGKEAYASTDSRRALHAMTTASLGVMSSTFSPIAQVANPSSSTAPRVESLPSSSALVVSNTPSQPEDGDAAHEDARATHEPVEDEEPIDFSVSSALGLLDWVTHFWEVYDDRSYDSEVQSTSEGSHIYHLRTRLPCRSGLLVDPGAHDNLCGSVWADFHDNLVAAAGRQAQYSDLSQPFAVRGVGKGGVQIGRQGVFPVGLQNVAAGIVDFTAPIVDSSEISALLGLKSLEHGNAVLDVRPGRQALYFSADIQIHMTPNTTKHILHKAPSGHLVLPT